MRVWVLRLVREDAGQDLIEYALLATFVSLMAIAGAMLLGNAINSWYEAVDHRTNSAAASAAS